MAINYSYKFYDRKEEKDVEIPKSVNNFLFSENPAKLGHNLKFDLAWLYECGFKYEGRVYDTMIAEYVLLRGLKKKL